MTNQAVLDASGIAKYYGAVRALRDANLHVRKGEAVALIGANGAGKSTFIKILTGAIRPSAGQVRIKGAVARVGNPAEARQSGLVPVYQEPSLVPDLSVGDNLRLSDTDVAAFTKWLETLGVAEVQLTDVISDLPLATLRILDLARAMAAQPDVLLLDEMTAALPTDMVDRVLKAVKAEAGKGMGVIYVSHRFHEIAMLCDRATVLRDGATVGDLPIEEGVEEKVVELMLGERLDLSVPKDRQPRPHPVGPPRLAVAHLAAGTLLKDVSFELYAGEVLGVVALEGQGQEALFETLAGFERPHTGTIEVDGTQVSFGHPAEAIAAGLTYVPGNRADALLAQRSVRENLALPFSAKLRDWGPLKLKHESMRVRHAIERLQIDTRAQGEVQRLSGGNQQKVTIGRWLAKGVETLLLFDPTRGIDVRTKRQIYPLARELSANGAAVLFYTSELEEVALACDRCIVIFNGRVVATLDVAEADEQSLMRAAYGLTLKQVAS